MSQPTPQPAPVPVWLQERQVFLALTIIIGVLAGLSAVLFSLAIEATSRGLFGLAFSFCRLSCLLFYRLFCRISYQIFFLLLAQYDIILN